MEQRSLWIEGVKGNAKSDLELCRGIFFLIRELGFWQWVKKWESEVCGYGYLLDTEIENQSKR